LKTPFSIEQQVQRTFKYLHTATSANYLGFTLLSGRQVVEEGQLQMSDGTPPGGDFDAAQHGLLAEMKATLQPVSYVGAEREVMLIPAVINEAPIAYLTLAWDKPRPQIDMETSLMFVDTLSIGLQGILVYDQLQYYVQALEYLGGLSTELGALPSIEEVLINATQIACALLNTKRCAVFLTKDYAIERVFAEGLSPAFIEKFQYADVLEQWKQFSHFTTRSAEILTLDGEGPSKIHEEWYETFKQEDIYSCIKASIQSNDRIYGSFWLLYSYPYLPTLHDVRLVEILVSQVATTLENLELNEAIQKHVDTLEDHVYKRTAELAIALEHAKDADRLKTQLLNVVSHELRTPLSVIKAQSSTLRSYYDRLPKERQMHYIETIDDEADKLTWMISNMLDMSKLAAGTLAVSPVPTDPSQVLTMLLDVLQVRFSGQSITLKVVGEFRNVVADQERICQVITNLVENAVKYSPVGRPIEIGARGWADALEIWVEDHGNGLAPVSAAQVFDRFFQVLNNTDRPSRTGVGLGLAICRGLVESMGGHIWCQSAGLDKGSKFSFTLPWAADTPEYTPSLPTGVHSVTNQTVNSSQL
jgi:signal transduction histidine kinase